MSTKPKSKVTLLPEIDQSEVSSAQDVRNFVFSTQIELIGAQDVENFVFSIQTELRCSLAYHLSSRDGVADDRYYLLCLRSKTEGTATKFKFK
jgi:hypothetical protein